ncbi:MAG: hypothetical protein KAS72_15180 [Phycisphaerales bacterium]|nr:hypothetical protein [Phycisphaerales bacterium]
MSLDHWMMFGTFAQQDVFTYPSKNTYKGVVINANMATHAPAGLAAFLHEKTADATYIIDPLTHAFQHDPRSVTNPKGETKSSVQSLAVAYGEPVESVVGDHPLLPDDLHDNGLVAEFAERCVTFQTDHLASYMDETDASKYFDEDERQKPPYAVVAPYFFISETTIDAWLEVNTRCIEHARNACGSGQKLFASVVIDQGVLEDGALRTRIIDAYTASSVDGFLVWVDDLDEQTASGNELRALVDLAKRLRGADGVEVINLHGGFFSIMAGSELGNHAFSGVTHGPEFGEYRSVVPVGGGIPIARYYIPQLHARIRYRDAARMFKEMEWLTSSTAFHKNVCDCEMCKGTLDGDAANFRRFGDSNAKTMRRRHGLVRIDFPTSDARNRCLRHYLQRKKREYVAASGFDEQQLVESVSRGYHDLKRVAGLEGVKHLDLWLRVLGRELTPQP